MLHTKKETHRGSPHNLLKFGAKLSTVERIYEEILNLDVPTEERQNIIKQLIRMLEGLPLEDLADYDGKKYYRTVYRVEVLSEEPVSTVDLGELRYLITDGDCSGEVDIIASSQVTHNNMVELLLEQGSDPPFLIYDYEETEGN